MAWELGRNVKKEEYGPWLRKAYLGGCAVLTLVLLTIALGWNLYWIDKEEQLAEELASCQSFYEKAKMNYAIEVEKKRILEAIASFEKQRIHPVQWLVLLGDAKPSGIGLKEIQGQKEGWLLIGRAASAKEIQQWQQELEASTLFSAVKIEKTKPTGTGFQFTMRLQRQ